MDIIYPVSFIGFFQLLYYVKCIGYHWKTQDCTPTNRMANSI